MKHTVNLNTNHVGAQWFSVPQAKRLSNVTRKTKVSTIQNVSKIIKPGYSQVAAVNPVKVQEDTLYGFGGISYDGRTPAYFMGSTLERCSGQGLLTNLQSNTNDHTGASKRERSFVQENKYNFQAGPLKTLYVLANENN